jgi:hypothetical protein
MTPSPKNNRDDRSAKALRDNLKRRKTWQRQNKEAEQAGSTLTGGAAETPVSPSSEKE